MVTVCVGLGSNLGDRMGHLRRGVEGLRKDVSVRAVSRVYETEPVGLTDQPAFLNAVLLGETTLSARALLELLQGVERAAGRVRTVRWGPRTLDLDLLLYGDRTIDEPDLQVPHPRLSQRSFALVPLLEIWPDARLPDGTALADVAARLTDRSGIRPWPGEDLQRGDR